MSLLQIILLLRSFIAKNITVSNKLITNAVRYEDVNIKDEIHVINNFNSSSNLNINILTLQKLFNQKFNCKSFCCYEK